MKAIRFLTGYHIFISFAALALAFATEVQVGLHPVFDASLVMIFLATLFEYNLHSLLKASRKQITGNPEKKSWSSQNLILVTILVFLSLGGVSVCIVFTNLKVVILFGLLALLAIFYSLVVARQTGRFRIKVLPGLKIFLIAFTWSAVTVVIPLLQAKSIFNPNDILFVFVERFTFIYAIALPFDIRDMEIDRVAGLRTVPIALGEKPALLLCNSLMVISLATAIFHYLSNQMAYILPAYIISVIVTAVFINVKIFRRFPLYYHGILDGCIVLHGVLLYLSYYFIP